ncbi:hypothetical protein PGT21_037295 [Puccinia graminis f. sp. tritici]|uniref:Uncharacterized protein n=1 Tax=Puccinia graminis f. sp. tritici TaxID=56615 RepID=A0A5B0R5I7_PUCGR|nr:hypothetical protein PGT21_037295 [Puccinia graminis f. sp. tritici]
MDPNTTVHSHLFGSEKPTSPLHHNPPSGNPTGHGFESIFGQIMKHLNALESNHHLLLKYAKDQVLGLGNSSLKVQSDLVKLEKINTTPEPSDQEFGLLDHIYQAHRAGPIPEHHCDPDLLQHDPNSTWKQSYKRCGNSGEEVFTTTDERFSIVGNNGRQERALPRLLPPSQACPPLFSLTAVAQTRLEEARLAAQTSRFPLPSPSETTQRESQWTGRARTCSPLSLVHALHQFACMNSSDDQANVAIIPKIQDYLEKACSIVCCIITKRSTLLYSASKKLQAISDPRTYTTIENLAQRVIRTCLAIKNQAISKPSESLMNLGRFSDDLLVRLMSHYSTLPDIRDLQSVSSELQQQSSYLTGLLTSYQSILQPTPTSVPEPIYQQLLEHQFNFGLKITTPIILHNFSLVIVMQLYQLYVSPPKRINTSVRLMIGWSY